MNGDPLDGSSKRLFRAARGESPPRGAERRAFEAARRELGKTRSFAPQRRIATAFAVMAGALALVAGLFWLVLRPPEPLGSIRAERVRPSKGRDVEKREAHSSKSAPAASTTALDVPVSPEPSARASASVAAKVRPAAPSLAEEIQLLRSAESALAASDPEGALKALDRFERVLKGRQMRAEATVLRIQALAHIGETEAAAALAQRFADENPTSPLVDRARSFIPPKKE